MINHLIFDLDGTLIDSALVCTDILNQMLRERGSTRVISADVAKPYCSRGGIHMVSGLLGDDCGDPHREIAEFRRRYSTWPTPHNSLFPGVHKGLRDLANAGFNLSVCSNKPQYLCEKVLSDLGLSSLFSAVVGSLPDRPLKPHPFLLERTLSSLDADPEEALFIGDSHLDEGIAASVGVPFLFVSYGYAEDGMDVSSLMAFDRFEDVVQSIRLEHAPEMAIRRVA